MIIVPIVFAFDSNWATPAAVCIYSLLSNAKDSTEYDVFILYPKKSTLNTTDLDRVFRLFPRHKVKYIGVGDDFNKAFQIRGINTLTYYRLLIPDLIPEYDKVLYSDVDVIFQSDLAEIYNDTDLKGKYLGVVNSLAHLDNDRKEYYDKNLKLDSSRIFYAGNIIINSRAIREAKLRDVFMSMIETKYRFQDMDILNITCHDKVQYLPPSFCVTTYFCEYANKKRKEINDIWQDAEIEDALLTGIIHYNGQKPWKGLCPNFDIWWEYYRKSPIYDKSFYYKFFEMKANWLDTLTLWKRIKTVIRYFTVGTFKS